MGRSEQTIKWYRQKMELYLEHEGGPAARVLKTRKPGPMDQVSNTGYRSKASPESGGGEGEI